MEVRILEDAAEATDHALAELRTQLRSAVRPLISFATGATYAGFFRRVAEEVAAGRVDLDGCLVTHPDEYVGYDAGSEGGMAHELIHVCPPLEQLLRRGALFPVPGVDDPEVLAAHRERLGRAGGVALQFLGLGRNGHVAFNEPGVGMQPGFQRVRLADSTRAAFRERFPDRPAPELAITAGLADLLESRRIVLMAVGQGKAPAVRSMLEGPVGTACPASVLRQHSSTLILLDRDAAGQLGAEHPA